MSQGRTAVPHEFVMNRERATVFIRKQVWRELRVTHSKPAASTRPHRASPAPRFGTRHARILAESCNEGSGQYELQRKLTEREEEMNKKLSMLGVALLALSSVAWAASQAEKATKAATAEKTYYVAVSDSNCGLKHATAGAEAAACVAKCV